MGLDIEKCQWAAEVLTYVVNHEESRLQTGRKRRAAIRIALDTDTEPPSEVKFRIEWIEKSALEVIRKLSEIATRFDKSNPDDQASPEDLMDILSTASSYIKKKLTTQDF